MGAKLNLQTEEDKNFVSATFDIGKLVFARIMRPWLYSPYIYYYIFPMGYRERKLIKVLHSFCDKIIQQKRNSYISIESYNYSESKKLAMLDILLKAQIEEGLIDEQGIKDEVNTFMFEVGIRKIIKVFDTVSSNIYMILGSRYNCCVTMFYFNVACLSQRRSGSMLQFLFTSSSIVTNIFLIIGSSVS